MLWQTHIADLDSVNMKTLCTYLNQFTNVQIHDTILESKINEWKKDPSISHLTVGELISNLQQREQK